MVYKKIITKIPNGKMLEVSLNYNNNRIIEDIAITGDFFIHPEESIEELEIYLKKKEINDILIDDIKFFLMEKGVKIVGFSVEDLVKSLISLSK